MKIYFIGFMGSGKSTVGISLAESLKYTFLDLDKIIEEKENISIADIFSENGEDHFREKERIYLRQIDEDDAVIATGGGTPCFHENMKWMNKNGLTIYLKADVDLLYDRLKDERHRPLLHKKEGEELRQYIKQMLAERDIYYNKAQMKVWVKDLDIRSLAEKIISL